MPNRVYPLVAIASFAIAGLFVNDLQAVDAVLTGSTYANPSKPNGVFYSSNYLAVTSGYYGFLSFGFASLPPGVTGAQIQKATLRLYVKDVVKKGTFSIYTPSRSWSETTLTYKNAPIIGANLEAVGQPVPVAKNEVTVDLTALTRDWIDGNETNNGIILSTTNAFFNFVGKQCSNYAVIPRLEITLASFGPQGVQGPQGPIGLTGPQGPQGVQGPAGSNGAVGPQGAMGITGPQGPPGPVGAQGPAGSNGVNGNTLLTSGTNPASSDGQIGDYLINTNSHTIFGPKSTNGWGVGFSMVGPQGQQGPAGTDGAVGPQGPQGIKGDTGLTGPIGPKGDTGAAGPQGLQGLKGDTGLTGPIGATGPAGAQGLKGDKGDTGATGSQGLQGLKGDKGDTGLTGPAGADGAVGPQGPQGLQGLKGDKGDSGAVGPQGLQGLKGDKGDTGLTGATGLEGPQGLKGDKGDTGATGAQGPQGLKGDAGLTGPAGADGAVGPQGPQGLKGLKGDTGATGATGATGPQGLKGDTGATGLQGIQGLTGATGAVGPQGPQGIQGLTGLQGPAGPAGPQGPAGTNGTIGPAGATVNLRVWDGYIQWQHEGDIEWQNLVSLVTLTPTPTPTTDTFGTGGNQFAIDFVTIGNPGNSNDTTGYGGVSYNYRIAKHTISQNQINAALNNGLTNVTAGPWSGNQPAANIPWIEAAAFVNWLNTSAGFQPAYNLQWNPVGFDWRTQRNSGVWVMATWSTHPDSNGNMAWTSGGTNLYRNANCIYFLPSENEWYKAAYYDPSKNGGSGGFWLYPTGSDTAPTAVASGSSPFTAVYDGQPGPSSIYQAGGLSPYGTMGQGGNVWQWLESSADGDNNDTTKDRATRCGPWYAPSYCLQSSFRQPVPPDAIGYGLSFRVARKP